MYLSNKRNHFSTFFQIFQLSADPELHVVALTADRLVNFRLTGDNSDLVDSDKPITRHLKSANWKNKKIPVTRLEQPNMIQGVAAAGNLKIPIDLYKCYK